MSARLAVVPSQAEAVAALESGAATGDVAPLRRIDTHMSHVFLGAGHVYKLKRAVTLPFADMSSLAQRRAACEAELAINQALAPALYEGVSAVVRRPDGVIGLDAEGEVIDWIVRLRRFDDGALFSELASAGRLTEPLVVEAVDAVAAFHAASAPHHDAGHAVDYLKVVSGLRRTESQAAARLGLKAASEPLFTAIEHEINRLAPLIETRRKAGFVRRGHGDLHLRNICRFEGRAMAFDALEFDPDLATVDVLYDVAFLLLDLRANGLESLAEAARRRYWAASGQPDSALVLLPLFMALRAAVRCAVSVEAEDLADAARYRDLGLEILGEGARLTSPGRG